MLVDITTMQIGPLQFGAELDHPVNKYPETGLANRVTDWFALRFGVQLPPQSSI